jgi:hypothetical protein
VALGGLAVAGGAEAGAATVSSIALVGVVRVAEGLGAGLVLPAALVVAWRHAPLRAVWAALLVASLIMATPLMLVTLPASASGWRTALQPGLAEIGAALAATAVWGILRGRRRREGLPAFRTAERTQLLLPLVPAVGFAVLAVVTSYDWSEGARYVVAGIGLAALLGLAAVGTRDATTGSRHGVAVVMVTAGVFGMQVATPLAGLLSTTAGPRHVALAPFALGALGALCGALAGWLLYGGTGRYGLALVLCGHGLVMAAVGVFLVLGDVSGVVPLSAALALLGAGLGTALTASLREASLGAVLFALGLLFPALLTGQLVVGALQVARVDAALAHGGGPSAVPQALTGAFREWLLVAGVVAVVLAGTAALAPRRGRSLRRAPRPARPDAAGGTPKVPAPRGSAADRTPAEPT